MAIFNFRNGPIDLGEFMKIRRNSVYGVGNDDGNDDSVSKHPTYEYPPAEFALFFKNPPYNDDPQLFRNFCFDDNYGNIYDPGSRADTEELTSNRFIRLFEFDDNVKFVYPSSPSIFTPMPGGVKSNIKGKSGYNKGSYLTPWLGIPIDLGANGSDPSVILPISNAWRLHEKTDPHVNDIDSYWRSKLPDKEVRLGLYSPDIDVSGVWSTNGNKEMTFDFRNNAQNENQIGLYKDPSFANNLFDSQITITLSATIDGMGRRTIINEDRPRRLYVIWKRGLPKKDQIVGSLAIFPMPIIDHYLLFINVVGADTDNDGNDDQWTFTPLGTTTPSRLVPAALDLQDNGNNHSRLGSVAANCLLNQYGVRLNTIDLINFTEEVYYQSINVSGSGYFLQIDPPTLRANYIYTDNLLTNWNIGAGVTNIFRNGIQNSFLSLLQGINTSTDLAGNLLPPDINGISAKRRINIQTPTINLNLLLSNLSIIYLCTSNAITNQPLGGIITLGEGSCPSGTNVGTGGDYFYCSSQLNPVGDFYNDVQCSFPHSVYLYETELNRINNRYPTNLIQQGNTIGGVSCHRESTLIHEMLHNFGLGHFFELMGTNPEDGFYLETYFQNNLNHYCDNESGNPSLILQPLKFNISQDWEFRLENKGNQPLWQRNANILNTLRQITSNTIINDVSFNYLDILSYYGFDALVQLFIQGISNLIRGFQTASNSPIALYQQPLNPPVSIPLSQVRNPNTGFIQAGNNPWIVLLNHICSLYQYQINNTSKDIYLCTYPPLNNPLNPSNPYAPGNTPILPMGTQALPDPRQTNMIRDSMSGNQLDYNFNAADGSASRDNPYFLDSNNSPSVRTDRGYLIKSQWDVIRHAIRHFNRLI